MTPVGVFSKLSNLKLRKLKSLSFLSKLLIKLSSLNFLIPFNIASTRGGCASKPNWLTLILILSIKSLRPVISPPLGPGINLSVLVMAISAPKSHALFWLKITVLSLAPEASSTKTGILFICAISITFLNSSSLTTLWSIVEPVITTNEVLSLIENSSKLSVSK